MKMYSHELKTQINSAIPSKNQSVQSRVTSTYDRRQQMWIKHLGGQFREIEEKNGIFSITGKNKTKHHVEKTRHC